MTPAVSLFPVSDVDMDYIAEDEEPEAFERRRRVFDWPEGSMVEMQRLHQ